MKQEIINTVDCLKEGGVILFPTNTGWSIGCDATNPKAVEKLFEIKKTSHDNDITVLLDVDYKLNNYIKEIPEIAWDLIEESLDPLTIIYPNAVSLAENILSEDKSIAICITDDEFCKGLINRFRKPIGSASVNINKKNIGSPFADINKEIINSVDYVVNWRQDEETIAKSTSIIKLGVNGEIKIIRK